MTFPQIHLGGTSAKQLLAEQVATLDALRKARAVLCNGEPNMRDYLRPGTWDAALAEHVSELQTLDALIRRHDDLAQHASGI